MRQQENLEVKVHPQLHREYEVSFGYMIPCLKTKQSENCPLSARSLQFLRHIVANSGWSQGWGTSDFLQDRDTSTPPKVSRYPEDLRTEVSRQQAGSEELEIFVVSISVL